MNSGKYLFHMFSLVVLVACAPVSTEAPIATEVLSTRAPATEVSATEAPTDPMADLIAAAQAEGILTTIALPHDWCKYGEVIETFKYKYGLEINELDPNAGFGAEIEAIKANKDNPDSQAPDVIDVGFAFGTSAKEQGLIQPYKVSTWDTIPADAKDPDGYWYGDYFSVVSFLVNTDVQRDVPRDWVDLMDPKYNGQVALSGDPRKSNQATQSIFAASLAHSGSLDDARPGLEFFAKLNTSGNLVPWIATDSLVATGETPIRIGWDHNAFLVIDSFNGNPDTEVVIPASGRFANVYIQAISAYAPHPNAAKLWMEFLYSDEGQLLWLEGYCHPIREADLRDRGVIPEDLLVKLPDVSGVVFPTLEQLDAARTLIAGDWDSIVGVDIQPLP